MNLDNYLEEKQNYIDRALVEFLPKPDAYPREIHEAMHYSVVAGGKRLRPILALAAGEAVGVVDLENMLPLAVALEYIHTYSLIHDDLPAMDDDDFRRGKPSCHRMFGEGIAILAGDALLTYAFEVLTKLAPPVGPYPESLVIRIIREISSSIGTLGLIGGQVVDLASENMEVNQETLEYIHQHKTGALFRTSILTGAMLGGATETQLSRLGEFANLLGLSFQITDDILDVVGDPELLGKPIGSDHKKQKATYPGLVGLNQAKTLVENCTNSALIALGNFNDQADPLRAIVKYIGQRSA